MVNLVESACRESVVHHLPGIKACDLYDENGGAGERKVSVVVFCWDKSSAIDGQMKHLLRTDGVNFHAMWDYQHIIKPDEIFSNDIIFITKQASC